MFATARTALALPAVLVALGTVGVPFTASAYTIQKDQSAASVAEVVNKCAIPNNTDPDTQFLCNCVRSQSQDAFNTVNADNRSARDFNKNSVTLILNDCKKQLDDAKAQQAHDAPGNGTQGQTQDPMQGQVPSQMRGQVMAPAPSQDQGQIQNLGQAAPPYQDQAQQEPVQPAQVHGVQTEQYGQAYQEHPAYEEPSGQQQHYAPLPAQ